VPKDTSKTTTATERHDFYQFVDPRYIVRLDHKQGGDTVMTMERVKEAIAFNVELADKSTWLLLTSEQMGFPLRH